MKTTSLVPTVCPMCGGRIVARLCKSCGNNFGRYNGSERRKKPRPFPSFSRGEITTLRQRNKTEWPLKSL